MIVKTDMSVSTLKVAFRVKKLMSARTTLARMVVHVWMALLVLPVIVAAASLAQLVVKISMSVLQGHTVVAVGTRVQTPQEVTVV